MATPDTIDQVNTPQPYAAWLADLGLHQVRVTVDERRLGLTEHLAWLLVTGSGFVAALEGLGRLRWPPCAAPIWTSCAATGSTRSM